MAAIARQRFYDDLRGSFSVQFAGAIGVTHNFVRRRDVDVFRIGSRRIEGDTEGMRETRGK
jgi:hypothetical protein